MASDSENPQDEGDDSAPVEWGTVNTVSNEGRQRAEQSTARRKRPRRPSMLDLPEGDGGLDIPIKSHRSYGGFFVLLVGVIGMSAGLYFLAQKGTEFEERVPEIPFAAENLIKKHKVDLTPPLPPPKTLINFESTPPGAQLVVNGRILPAPTPTAVQVPVDQGLQVWMRKPGHLTAERFIKAKSGGGSISMTLEKGDQPTGSLEVISSPEGAQVMVDGQPMGVTPITLPKVPADQSVVIAVEKEGHHRHVLFYRLAADEKRKVGLMLTRDRGIRVNAVIHVKTFPKRTDVVRMRREKKEALGQTGRRSLDFAVPQGQLVHLRATATRHTPAEAAFEIDGPEYTVLLRLKEPEKTYGALTLTGSKALTVYVDSSELDPLPVKKLKMYTGTHRIVVVNPATRKRAKAEFTVTEGVTVQKKVELVDGEIVIR